MSLSRSFLFVPGDRSDRFAKATSAGADEVIVDLEDGVAPDRKVVAREAVRGWEASSAVIVRVNSWETEWWKNDLDMVRERGIRRVMVPKSEPESLGAISDYVGNGVQLIALIETVSGLLQLRRACSITNVTRLAFGNLDFGVDSGIADESLDYVRLQLALESRFANLPPPIDGVSQVLSDASRLEAQARLAKSLGFGGKLCIHPAQIAPVNKAFTPTSDELAWANRVIEAVRNSGPGAIALDGKMIDRPVVERAKAILQAAN